MRLPHLAPISLLALAFACNGGEPPPATPPPAPSASTAPSAAPESSASAAPSASAPPVASVEPPIDAGPPPLLDAGPLARPTSAAVVVRIERTVCFGTCPAYKLALRADGTYLFGEWYPKKGCRSGSIPKADVDALLTQAKSMGYAGLRDSYEAHVTDLPSTNTEVTLGGKTKKIHHYGNSGDPIEPQLRAFEQAIDKAVDVDTLLKGPLSTCGAQDPYPKGS